MNRLCPRLRKYSKQEIPSGISHIEIPVYDKQGEISEFRSVTEPFEIFSHQIRRNSDHFFQAKSSPFVEGIFGQDLPPFQQNDFSESILKGTINLEHYDVNEAIKSCISEMRYAEGGNGENPFPSAIKVTEFKQGFRRIAEKASSSPSRRHILYYKAILKGEVICMVYSTLMALPFEYGFALNRWSNALGIMLEKIKRIPRIEKLRVIQLMEADLNMMIRIIFGRQLVHRAEGKGSLSSLQWGSQPKKSSTDAILIKRLTYDGIRICKQVAVIFNNDGKAAFDRIVPSVGGIALRQIGASHNAITTLLQTLEKMTNRICTSLGISEMDSYSNIQNWVLGTTLQGSGALPALCWLAITCVLLGSLSKKSRGITFQNPRGTQTLTRAAETPYVDDTELFLALDHGVLTELISEMQENAQHWEKLLYTTGGALAVEKCFFVAMDWEIANDEMVLKQAHSEDLKIQLKTGHDYTNFETIPQKPASNGPRNLGAHLASYGNNKDEIDQLIHRGKTYSQNIAASGLKRNKVMIAYRTMIQPAMKYPSYGSNLTRNECVTIDRSYFPAILSRMGFNSQTKQVLFFCPLSMGAYGFADSYTHQGIIQLQKFISQPIYAIKMR